MPKLAYSDSTEFLCEALQYVARGEDVEADCPKCGKPLVIAVTRAQARNLGVHPGIYCTVSRGHVYQLFSLMDREIPEGESWLDKLKSS